MSTIEAIRLYCLEQEQSEESCPFGPDTLVYKVNNKIFALINIKPPFSINLKCDPEKAIELREEFVFVKPGYHMNKAHWNTIDIDQCPFPFLKEQIDHSYSLIISKSKPKTNPSKRVKD